ncbi:MAG: hypothetical protein K0R63_931 [Rickettsiales bacterium]|jgi:hypothetical protein|nr:hypothetical protein [Rickettsiales bacterium]
MRLFLMPLALVLLATPAFSQEIGTMGQGGMRPQGQMGQPGISPHDMRQKMPINQPQGGQGEIGHAEGMMAEPTQATPPQEQPMQAPTEAAGKQELSQALRQELEQFKEANKALNEQRKVLYEKLSPEAKQIVQQHMGARQEQRQDKMQGEDMKNTGGMPQGMVAPKRMPGMGGGAQGGGQPQGGMQGGIPQRQ